MVPQVWKSGVLLRVDGSLMGLDDKSTSLIPQWKRGHFSLVFNGSTQPATLHFLDHRKQRFFDLNAERKKHASASIEAQVGTPHPAGWMCWHDLGRCCGIVMGPMTLRGHALADQPEHCFAIADGLRADSYHLAIHSGLECRLSQQLTLCIGTCHAWRARL